jgi:hypothetical protein
MGAPPARPKIPFSTRCCIRPEVRAVSLDGIGIPCSMYGRDVKCMDVFCRKTWKEETTWKA